MIRRALIVVALLALCTTAHAEPARERVLPVGTAITLTLPGGERISETVEGEDQLQIHVSTGRAGVEAGLRSKRLEAELLACSRNAAIVKAQPSPFWTAVKWTALGVGLGAAFALGVAAAR
jgi:hypothetical protein